MNRQEDDFVRSGFESYPQAINAIDAFARLLGGEFKQAVSRLEAPPGLRIETCSESMWSSEAGSGCWVFSDVVVVKGQTKFSLDFGWWWNAPGAPLPLVAYCTVKQGSRRLRLEGQKSDKAEEAKIDGVWRLLIRNTANREATIELLLTEALRIILDDGTAET